MIYVNTTVAKVKRRGGTVWYTSYRTTLIQMHVETGRPPAPGNDLISFLYQFGQFIKRFICQMYNKFVERVII